MSGEDFFKFNSGKEFRFSNFREIKEEDLKGVDEKIKKLFNIFAGDDKILQANEAQSLFNALKSAAGDNKTLETDEIKMFTEEKIGEEVDTNIFANFVNNVFGVNKRVNQGKQSQTQSFKQTFLEEAACKEIVINIIDENLSEAYEILNSQYLGAISDWHDARKDKNDILKTSNVAKVLDYQNAGVEWMNKAKLAPPNGLTKKEYYEGNKQRIKDMILTRVLVLDTNTKFKELKNKYSEEKLAQIIGDYVEALCSNATMADLKNIQKNFVSYSGVEETQALENVVDNAIKFNEDKNKPMPAGELAGIKLDTQKGIIPEYWNSDKPISFEEVYEIERGTVYSQYKIEQYALARKEMEIVANAYNKKQQFVEFAESLRNDETLSSDEKGQKVLDGFATFYALSEDGGLSELKELISESKLPVSVDENGFNFGTLDDSSKKRVLNSLLKLAQQQKEAEFEKFLNGKTIEEYQTALEKAQNEAIGEENGKMMAEAMKNDNLTCIQRWTGNTSMIGMGMTVVGGLLCFTPLAPLGAGMVTAGNTLAIGGIVAETGLGVADYTTKDIQTAEEAEQLGKNFLMNAGGFIIGMGAGKAGIKAFNKLIDEKLVAVFGKQIAAGNKMQALKTVFTNPEYLKNFMTAAGAKLSADFVISYAGDLAMMGVLDTDDNWQSLLKANLTGILVGMSGDIKDVSGVGRPRNIGLSDGVKPMTEFDYGQRLLGNDVTIVDPKTGTNIDGTVTGLHNNNGQVEIEVNGQRYSTNDVSRVRGENIAENSLLEKAANENPVWVAEGKIKDKWLSQGLEETDAEFTTKPIIFENGKATLDIKAIEEFNQNYKSEPIDEVSKLIFSGKLNETLTKRYEEMGRVFEELGQIYNTKFNELAVKYKDDSAKYAEEVIKILSKEFGMEGFEIPVEFISGNGKTCYFDYIKGKILMDRSITNAKDFTTLLVHEFKHSLQFRDLTAQYGIEGVIDIIINDKSIKPNERNATLNKTLNNPYNKRLLTEYNFATVQKGSVSDYLNRIYKDEFTDTKTTDPEYIEKQIIEPEAYYSSNGKFANNIDLEGRNITKPYTEQEISELKAKGEIYETSTGALSRLLDDGSIERIYNILPAGISSGMSDAEFYTKGIDLCKRSDGSISPAAEALLKSLRDSELENTSYDVNNSKLEDFNTMSRDYKNNLLSEEMLGYAKEFVDCIPKGKDKYLTESTEYSINNLITNLLDYAKPGERQEIVNAAKKLFSNPNVRNSVVDDIISACVEGNYNEGYTFNKNVFERIYATFEKKIKNRESEPDQSYSLMISEIAKNGIYYEKDANGGYIKRFDDIGFKIGMILPEADPHGHYVHYDLTKDRNTGEINLHNIDRNTQNYIIRNAEENYFQAQKERSEYNLRIYKYETKIEYDEYAEPLKRLCMVDGKLDVQNCFAVDYMINDLGLDKSKVVKILENYRNQDGILDMTMLRLIKNEREDYHKVGVLNTLQKLEQDNSFLYNENGNVNEEIFQNLKNAPITRSMTIRISDYFWHDNYNYDISKHYMTDGKIDFQKLKTVESELANIVGMLGIKCDNAYERCTVSNLYNTIKANPDDASKIFASAQKVGIFALAIASDKNGKGINLDELYYYASLPDDLYKLIKSKYWLLPFVKGEPATNDVDWYIKNDLKPQDKVILDKYGINIDYVMSSRKNQFNRKSEVSQEAQNQLEHTIDTLDRTLSNADVSSGIELEYSRAQFERDLIAAVKDLPQVRANYILNSFGLTLRNGKIEGIITKPQMDAPQNLANIEQEIKQCIEKFQNNRVLNQDPSLNAVYDSLTKDFPEFAMLVGKVGSDGQRVDVTVLRQMQALINNSQYQKLSPEEQKMAKLTLMLRAFDEVDSTSKIIEKSFTTDNDGRAVNVSHKRYKNGDFAWAILERFNLTDAEKYAVTDLVAHSGWSKEYNEGVVDIGIARDYKPEWIERNGVKHYPEINPENNANKVAVNTRFGTLKLSKLIEDIIYPNNNVDIKSIEAAQKRVYQNMQIVNSVSAKDLEPYWETQIIDGVECQVIDLRKTKLPDDFYLMGHFTEHGVEHLYNLLNNKNDKVFFSNSLLKANSASTFAGRTEGIISEFDNRNVAETHCYNIDSGFGKSYNDFVLTMSGKGGYHDVANIVKKNLGLTNEEYGALIEQIVDKRFNELDDYYNINGRYLSKQEIVDAHNAAYENLLRSQGEQNEITILNQTPIAFVYSASNTYNGVCPFSMKDSPLRRVIIFP